MNKFLTVAFATALFLEYGCKVHKKDSTSNAFDQQDLEAVTITATAQGASKSIYRSSEPRWADLIHTTLHVSFNYATQSVNGKAILKLKPHFYPIQNITIDAKQFDLHQVALLTKDTIPLQYSYDSSVITIDLPRLYTRNDTFSLVIRYTAHPNNIKEEGSNAITDAKGLYFINPVDKRKGVPRQIWSQGETQSNSGWFPTIDKPNQKMTQDLYLTVDSSETTLSNGILVFSENHDNGTRTDLWSQRLPHAPYLTMVAIGQFVETKDTWRDSIEVNYYLEPTYAPYAKLIFGCTPAMMEFYSKKLGVDYPWQKFSQVVVRDFVSGAMENTTAVIHFEPVQHNSREHLDNTWEDIIAHELFHHWFGDLVTCESWSNISLNESFATYGEYLWHEHAYGKNHADYYFDDNLQSYLQSKSAAGKELVRYHYKQREQLFDVVSYQKGSRILHLLRNQIGDEAFFEAITLYLNRYRFQTVEVHQLRLAFEEVTGQDLNPFFNQWFLGKGHPVLDVTYTYTNDRKKVSIAISQKQDSAEFGIFSVPTTVLLKSAKGKQLHTIQLNRKNQVYTFESVDPILYSCIDADFHLLAAISEHKEQTAWLNQLVHEQTYLPLKQATEQLIAIGIDTQSLVLKQRISQLLVDSFFGNREIALSLLQNASRNFFTSFKLQVEQMAMKDPHSRNRALSLAVLSKWDSSSIGALLTKATRDSSYLVAGTALQLLAENNMPLAFDLSLIYLNESNSGIQRVVSSIIAKQAKGDFTSYYEGLYTKGGRVKFHMQQYKNYLANIEDTAIVRKSIPFLVTASIDDSENGKYAKDVLTGLVEKLNIILGDKETLLKQNPTIVASKELLRQDLQRALQTIENPTGR
ncbi:MAG: M1 family metallopeptidase [Bacteroidia bacterium]|nr:M1 family metallopeptidase [Bacteroidia bacterium]